MRAPGKTGTAMDRKNSATQAAIDEGIVMFDRGRIPEALAFLAANSVPGDVVRRVLYYPERRRQYINDFLTGY
jgi:hypothetical protein